MVDFVFRSMLCLFSLILSAHLVLGLPLLLLPGTLVCNNDIFVRLAHMSKPSELPMIFGPYVRFVGFAEYFISSVFVMYSSQEPHFHYVVSRFLSFC